MFVDTKRQIVRSGGASNLKCFCAENIKEPTKLSSLAAVPVIYVKALGYFRYKKNM
jgi:hypothetical protein